LVCLMRESKCKDKYSPKLSIWQPRIKTSFRVVKARDIFGVIPKYVQSKQLQQVVRKNCLKITLSNRLAGAHFTHSAALTGPVPPAAAASARFFSQHIQINSLPNRKVVSLSFWVNFNFCFDPAKTHKSTLVIEKKCIIMF
jgi:hypothetical protein